MCYLYQKDRKKYKLNRATYSKVYLTEAWAISTSLKDIRKGI